LQPPLPLQLFFPLQPISPVLQPPLPLQLFRPLQSCLSTVGLVTDAPESLEVLQPVVPKVPASKPAMAAVMTNVLAVLDIVFSFQFAGSSMNDRRPNNTARLNTRHWMKPDGLTLRFVPRNARSIRLTAGIQGVGENI
jgi:hypothetical protein